MTRKRKPAKAYGKHPALGMPPDKKRRGPKKATSAKPGKKGASHADRVKLAEDALGDTEF